MKESSVPAGIGAEDWAATPPAVRVLVAGLRGQVVALTEQAQALTGRVAALEEQVRHISRNSSKPPSSDPPRGSPRGGVRAGNPAMRGTGGRCCRPSGSPRWWTSAPRPAGAAACRWRGTIPGRGAIR